MFAFPSLPSLRVSLILAATLGVAMSFAQPRRPIPVKPAADPSYIPADSIVAYTTLTKDNIWVLRSRWAFGTSPAIGSVRAM